MKDLIKLRKSIKAKKPNFRRQDSHKKKRIDPAWRKPKGIQSKMRLSIKGYCRLVKDGFGAPRAVKTLSKEGLQRVNVATVQELDNIDNKMQGIIINSTVGARKRMDIIRAAKEKQIMVLNLKNPDKVLSDAESAMKQRRESKQKRREVKAAKEKKKKESIESKVSKEKMPEEGKDDGNKEQKEKKEKDKMLIKRELQ